jgi:hypothetical protein
LRWCELLGCTYVPPETTEDALRARVSEIVEGDWAGMAERTLAELAWDGGAAAARRVGRAGQEAWVRAGRV